MRKCVEYLLKDRLGSVDAVADGTLTETRGYDPFGKPRPGTWADLSPARLQSLATTPKGFTQHEHLNQVEADGCWSLPRDLRSELDPLSK